MSNLIPHSKCLQDSVVRLWSDFTTIQLLIKIEIKIEIKID